MTPYERWHFERKKHAQQLIGGSLPFLQVADPDDIAAPVSAKATAEAVLGSTRVYTYTKLMDPQSRWVEIYWIDGANKHMIDRVGWQEWVNW